VSNNTCKTLLDPDAEDLQNLYQFILIH